MLNVASTAGATLQALGFIIIFINLVYALKNGADRRRQPLGGQRAGVEDHLAAAQGQLRRDRPIVDEDAYTYQKKGEKVEHVVV